MALISRYDGGSTPVTGSTTVAPPPKPELPSDPPAALPSPPQQSTTEANSREAYTTRAGTDYAAQQQARLQTEVSVNQTRTPYRGGEATIPISAQDTTQTVAKRSLAIFAAQSGLPDAEQQRFADDWAKRLAAANESSLYHYQNGQQREWTPAEFNAAKRAGFTVLSLSEKNQPNIVADLQRRQQQLGVSALTYEETQLAGKFQRTQIAQNKAAQLWASLPANERQGDALAKFIEQHHVELTTPILTQYMELRGDAPRELSGAALTNEIGMAMNLPPNNAPQTAAQQQAFNDGTHEFYKGDARAAIEPVVQAVKNVGGETAKVTVLPVVFSSKETGLVQVPLFRVEGRDGRARFVDNVGRTYSSLQDWRDNNKLPAGQVSYPKDGRLTPAANGQPQMVTENSHAVPDTFWEKARPWVDGAVTVAGIGAGVLVIIGSGGTAAPLVLGGAALYGATRSGSELYDRAAHGQTLSPTDPEARMMWLDFGANTIGAAGVGASLRAASLAAKGVSAATTTARVATALNVAGQYADTGATVNQTLTLAANWDKLTPEQRLQQVGQIAFWTTMTGAQARQAGGLKNLYGAQAVNNYMGQLRQGLQNLDPRQFEVRQVRDAATGQTYTVISRKEPGAGDNVLQMTDANPTGGGTTRTNSSDWNDDGLGLGQAVGRALTRTDVDAATRQRIDDTLIVLDQARRSGRLDATANKSFRELVASLGTADPKKVSESLAELEHAANVLQTRGLAPGTKLVIGARHGQELRSSGLPGIDVPNVEADVYYQTKDGVLHLDEVKDTPNAFTSKLEDAEQFKRYRDWIAAANNVTGGPTRQVGVYIRHTGPGFDQILDAKTFNRLTDTIVNDPTRPFLIIEDRKLSLNDLRQMESDALRKLGELKKQHPNTSFADLAKTYFGTMEQAFGTLGREYGTK